VVAAADTVLVGGRVWTPGWETSRERAIAIRGGRIVALGADDEIRSHVSASTDVVPTVGQLVVPSFQDAHVHPVHGGLNRLRCDLSELVGTPSYLEAIASYVSAHPEREWVLGGGWSMDAFPGGIPTAQLLDEVVADRPVFLVNRDGHGAWVNSRALVHAGIDASTADPPDGRIERDASGAPNGALHEGAMRLVARVVPQPSGDDLAVALRDAQSHLHGLGITAWQDAIVGQSDFTGDALAIYRQAAERGELTARVVGALWWDRDRGLEQIDDLVERRAWGSSGRFRATSVKIMADGVCENFTAAMLDPYLDESGEPTGGRGISFVPPEVLEEAVPMLDAAGFQVHVHAIGDRAVRDALDAFATARTTNADTDLRHHIAHLQVVHHDDVPRLAPLGVVANAQPLWATYDAQMTELTIPFLGDERARRQYLWRTLQRHGARLAFGSDWPVSSPNPMSGIHVAVNRTAPCDEGGAGDGSPFLPDERLDLATALTAYTAGSAYVNHLDEETGHLDIGYRGDLAVLEPDPFSLDPAGIDTVRVAATFLDGVAVHS
jgi:predicted amidohydrolase YtcJ